MRKLIGAHVARLVNVPYQGRMVQGEELNFEPINESWNEYACDDGSTVKVRVLVSRITRLVGEKNEDGEPVYVLKIASVVSATPSPERKG